MRRKTGLIGMGTAMDLVVLATLGHGRRVIVIQEDPNILTICGQKYEAIHRDSPVKLAPRDLNHFGYARPRPQVSIEKEFELIQKKKSQLCRSDRDWVVSQFFKLYKKI